MTKSVHVVCFGKDQQLLQTREAVLALEFRTTPVDTLVSFLELSHECHFEVAVLCHTLPKEDYEQAVNTLHSSCPRAGIIAVTSGPASGAYRGSDRTIRGLDGPEALLATVRATLMEKHLLD